MRYDVSLMRHRNLLKSDYYKIDLLSVHYALFHSFQMDSSCVLGNILYLHESYHIFLGTYHISMDISISWTLTNVLCGSQFYRINNLFNPANHSIDLFDRTQFLRKVRTKKSLRKFENLTWKICHHFSSINFFCF